MNPGGSALVYSTYLGGIGSEAGYGVAVDLAGNSYITGYSYGEGFPLVSPLQSLNHGVNDAFVTKLNAAGSALIFSTYLGGSGNDTGQSIAVDRSGNVYVIGGTFSADFQTTPGAAQTTYPGGAYDAFVVKMSGLALPVCSLSAMNLIFSGQGAATTSLPKTITLSNDGDAALTLSGIVAAGDFAETNNCGPSVAPAASCTLSLTSSPTALGPRAGTISIIDNAWGSPHVIRLTGNGIPTAILTVALVGLTFAAQLVGSSSSGQSVVLRNSGSYALQITSIAAGGDFAQTNNCASAIQPGASCVLNLIFTPGVAGTSTGQVTIVDSAPASPHAILLTGTGTNSNSRLSPAALLFSDQLVGTSSAIQTVSLSSTGASALTVTGIVASGDFAQTNNCLSPVAVGSTCAINVTFNPTMSGTRTGVVTITDDAPGSPNVVALTGNGIIPTLVISTSTLAFAGQNVSTTSLAQLVTLSSSGTAPLIIANITASGDFAETNTGNASIAVGASCSSSVVFNPSASGSRAGVLTITDNAADSPQSISLFGTGTAPAVTLSSGSLTYASQNVMTTSPPQMVTLTNNGTATLSIAAVATTGGLCRR